MKLDLLHSISNSIYAELTNAVVAMHCYYFFEENWYDIKDVGVVISNSTVTNALNESRKASSAYYQSASKRAWFHFADVRATITLDFKSSPKAPTREKYRQKLEAIRTNAINAYKVSHNELTGLLSRDTFRKNLQEAITQLNDSLTEDPTLGYEGQQSSTVTVAAFDIDKFKQVNDTYGHLYGDQVLKAFAWRLEKAAEAITTEYGRKIKIILGHPSGEEFLACVVGQLTNDELTQIAEKFRLSIADDPLPSEPEWKRLLENSGLEKVRLPSKSERNITTSVGVASYTGSKSDDSNTPLVLLDKADIALYKSKSNGRNRVTQFEEILQRCGTVLEHDQNSGVVAIDIGSKVGVLVGQEFRVYPTSYSGKTSFTVDDGRSKKSLGTYPKIELCRIVIFNSQNDISFGQLANQSTTNKIIPSGSLLEAVPLGSITHLLDQPNKNNDLFPYERQQTVYGGHELKEHLLQLIEHKKNPFAAVIKFKQENSFYKKYGSAALNRALAQTFSHIRTKFDGNRVGLIDTTAICVVGDSSKYSSDEINTLLSEIYKQQDELEPICGYFDYKLGNKKNKSTEGSQFNPYAIELAKFVLSDNNGFNHTRTQAFSISIVERIFGQHWTSRAYASCITDYLRLKEIGIKSGTIENYAGLCYSQQKDHALALQCYQRAMEIIPTNLIFKGNVAIKADILGEIDTGLEVLANLNDEQLEELKISHPYAFWIYAELLVDAKYSGSTYYSDKLLKKVGTEACDMENVETYSNYSYVREAVDSLSTE